MQGRGGLRFAFYGRVSAEDWQDPVTSRARQREPAGVLVAGHGKIVAGFFDAGQSRTLPWARRLQAAALVAALADPGRNPHRTGAGWTLRTVAAILGNPRYTGRQVQNRQRTDFDLVDPGDTGLGHKQVQRWNLPEGWVISKHPAHPALVSEAGFIAAQDATAPRGPAGAAVPAGRAAGLRPVRAAAGIGLVQRQARLPVPPRVHQRRRR